MSNCVHSCTRGWLSNLQKACKHHAPAVVTKYQKQISVPLLDRIDIHIEVPRVDYEKLSSDRIGETSESIRMRVREIRQFCKLQNGGAALSMSTCQSSMRAAMTQLNLSTRAYHRFLNWRARYGINC